MIPVIKNTTDKERIAMKKVWKSFFVTVLSAGMVLGLAACGVNKSVPKKGTDSKEILTEAGTYPIVTEEITLKMMIMSKPWIENYNTNDFTKYLEELTGINLEIEAVDWETSNEKINLAMSGGDYPDIIMLLNPDVVKYGVKENMFLQLDDLIEPNMPNYMAGMSEYNDLIRQSDGHIYALPVLNEAYHMYYPDKMWANTYKMRELGIPVPANTEELYKACKLYLEKEPTGVVFSDWSKGLTLNWLMNAFILTPNDDHHDNSKVKAIVSPEGKVVSAATQEEYKDGLTYIKSLYDLGAIYEGNFANTEDSLKSLINQDGEPVLFFPRNYSAAYIDSTANNELYRHYEVIPPVEGPEGLRQTPFYRSDSIYENRFVITDKCQYPEAALRLADWFYTDKNDLIAQYGADEGIDWVWKPEGKVGINGKPAMYDILNPYSTDVQNHDWQVTGMMYATSDFRLGQAMEAGIDKYDPAALEKLLFEETNQKMEPYAPKKGDYDVLPILHMTSEEKDEISVALVETGSYIAESRIAFITGKMDIDADWNSYISKLDNLGLQTVLDVYQAAYDR